MAAWEAFPPWPTTAEFLESIVKKSRVSPCSMAKSCICLVPFTFDLADSMCFSIVMDAKILYYSVVSFSASNWVPSRFMHRTTAP